MVQGKIVNMMLFHYFFKYFCKVARKLLVLNRILFILKYHFEGILEKGKYYVFLGNIMSS